MDCTPASLDSSGVVHCSMGATVAALLKELNTVAPVSVVNSWHCSEHILHPKVWALSEPRSKVWAGSYTQC
jgi:hypothetical protein